jgi:uncharacterized membrane protein YbaN (DUF454 family)
VWKKLQRLLWFTLGHFFLLLGIVGVFLPVIPTVPFIVIASACYSKVSPKFRERLRNNRWFGKAVRDWEDERAISKRSKLIVFASLITSVIFVTIFLSILWIKMIVFIVAVFTACFILTRPTAK